MRQVSKQQVVGREVNRINPALTDLLNLRVPFPDAVRIALWREAVHRGRSAASHSRSAFAEFAARHGLNRNNLTNSIYNGRTPTEAMIHALVAELGADSDWWREQIWHVGKPVSIAV
jgi:hypothetical protein